MTSVREIFETMEYGPAPESPKPAQEWLDAHDGRFGHFINGKLTKPTATFEVTNPATGQRIADV